MIVPDIVVPEQFSQPPNSAQRAPSEVALLYAILEDALRCVQHAASPSRRAQRLAREAEEWFFSDDDHWPFSFVNICAVLGLDPEYIRLGLKCWQEHHSAEPPPRRKHGRSLRQPLYCNT